MKRAKVIHLAPGFAIIALLCWALAAPADGLSVVVMRVVNILLFVGITSALFVLLPVRRRSTLIWMWLITTMPLGISLLSSTSPSAWAIIGVGSGWLALLGYLESTGRRKFALGALFALATIMAASSRGDAAVYAVLGIAAVIALTVPWRSNSTEVWRKYSLDAVLPATLVVACAIFFLSSSQSRAAIDGVRGGGPAIVGSDGAQLSGFGQFAYNLLNMPFLWAGNFGEAGLGSADTSMPAIVFLGATGVVVAVVARGLGSIWPRKLIVVAGVALALWLLPLYVLTQGGGTIGEQVQSHHVLPLIVLFAGLALMQPVAEPLAFSRLQLVLIAGTLAVVNFVALHMQGAPMALWLVGSFAFAAAVTILIRYVAWPRAAALAAGDEVEHQPQYACSL